jgi:hypothetical protein
MPLPSVRNVLRLGIGLLAPIALVVALAGPSSAAALDPEQVQVQYLPRDGAAIVLWNAVDKATGYNVYQQEVTKPGSPSTETTASAPVKVNTDPIAADIHSLMVENLTNGKAYHFTMTAIVDGKESDPVGPRVAVSGDDLGAFVAVVPQKPVKLAGLDGFYGYNIGTDLPGSHAIDDTGTTITMKASGWDIQNSADGQYLLAVPVKGDVTVTARLVSGPTETANQSTWNLGGPQIRGTLDAGSVLAMTQGAHAGKLQFKYREEYDTSPPEEHDSTGTFDDAEKRPLWLRVVRKGNDFSGFASYDGNAWTPLDDAGVGGIHTIKDMPQEAYVGLALSAHDDGEYSTAVFDNFTISSP